jgi:hypothetical protein
MITSSFFRFSGPGGISIAKWVPRSVVVEQSFPLLAPFSTMMNLSFNLYAAQYDLILKTLDPRKVWDELHVLAGGHEPVLLCWEKPPLTDDNFCHRRLAAAWLERHIGVTIPESSTNQGVLF